MSKNVISQRSFTSPNSLLEGALPLPDGRDAGLLRLGALRAALKPILGELDPHSGKHVLLQAYADHLAAAAEAGVAAALEKGVA